MHAFHIKKRCAFYFNIQLNIEYAIKEYKF